MGTQTNDQATYGSKTDCQGASSKVLLRKVLLLLKFF